MINGEKIKVLLKPREDQIKIYGEWVEIEIQSLAINFSCSLDWWNAEYKEPTTKNDLGVDKLLSDCEKMSFDIEIFNKPLKVVALDAVKNIVNELPSVTPQEPTRMIDKSNFSQEQYKADLQSAYDCGVASVNQEPRWIPVNEKLPNDRNWYLGIFKEPDTGWINPIPFICDYVGRETKATTKEHWILHGFTDMDEHIDYYFNLECVAWMPLPQAESEG